MNEVLWFASPPVDVAPPVQKPMHSSTYLHYLAKKRKLELEEDEDAREGEDSKMDVDGDEPACSSVVIQLRMSIDEACRERWLSFRSA